MSKTTGDNFQCAWEDDDALTVPDCSPFDHVFIDVTLRGADVGNVALTIEDAQHLRKALKRAIKQVQS